MKNIKIIMVFGILVLSAGIRFPFIATFPPLGIFSIYHRLFSALCGVASIGLFMWILDKMKAHTWSIIFCGLAMSLMPWHIEQSRIYSPAMLLLTAYLASLLIWLQSSKLMKASALILICLATYLFFPPVWGGDWHKIQYGPFLLLKNVFHLSSVQFWFFENDSFWIGGLRERGAILPSMLPIFIIGLSVSFKQLKAVPTHIVLMVTVVVVISSMSNLFPDTRLPFLLIPLAVLVLGKGAGWLQSQLHHANYYVKTIIVMYLLFVTYDYLVFLHYYVQHYTQRILHSVPYEERIF